MVKAKINIDPIAGVLDQWGPPEHVSIILGSHEAQVWLPHGHGIQTLEVESDLASPIWIHNFEAARGLFWGDFPWRREGDLVLDVSSCKCVSRKNGAEYEQEVVVNPSPKEGPLEGFESTKEGVLSFQAHTRLQEVISTYINLLEDVELYTCSIENDAVEIPHRYIYARAYPDIDIDDTASVCPSLLETLPYLESSDIAFEGGGGKQRLRGKASGVSTVCGSPERLAPASFDPNKKEVVAEFGLDARFLAPCIEAESTDQREISFFVEDSHLFARKKRYNWTSDVLGYARGHESEWTYDAYYIDVVLGLSEISRNGDLIRISVHEDGLMCVRISESFEMWICPRIGGIDEC